MEEERANRANEIAPILEILFNYLDLIIDKTDILQEAQKELREKINNEQTLTPVALAFGINVKMNYDIEEAKIEELKALVKLIEARKELIEATKKNYDKEQKRKQNAELIKQLFM